MSEKKPVIAILGGTGGLGTGLARRWVQSGHEVIIGSRSAENAAQAAVDLEQLMKERGVMSVAVRGMDNAAAAGHADIVALTVPFSHQAATLDSVRAQLQGKILIDTTVPLVPPKVSRVQLPEQGSAGQIAQGILGDGVHVVAAFQNVPAPHLQAQGELDCDVLVCGNSKEARARVIELVEATGMRGLHGGPIENAAAVEAMTSLLIFVNKQHGCHAGIKITGIE